MICVELTNTLGKNFVPLKELVEHLYFRDDSMKAIQDELDDFLGKPATDQHEDSETAAPEVSEEFVSKLNQLGSTYPNTDAEENRANRIDSNETASKAIKSIDVNDHLMKVFMKYRKFFGHKQMMEFFEKLRENLANQETVRQREIKKFNLKVQRLQKVSPQLGIKFRTVFLTKEEIGKHPIFQIIIDDTNSRIESETCSLSIIIEYYLQMMDFRPLKDIMVPDFLDVKPC